MAGVCTLQWDNCYSYFHDKEVSYNVWVSSRDDDESIALDSVDLLKTGLSRAHARAGRKAAYSDDSNADRKCVVPGAGSGCIIC